MGALAGGDGGITTWIKRSIKIQVGRSVKYSAVTSLSYNCELTLKGTAQVIRAN